MEYQKWEKSEWKEKVVSASRMPASPLMQAYQESLRIDGNPLSKIFEKEILHRLWGYENSRNLIKCLDRLCSEEMAECGVCMKC